MSGRLLVKCSSGLASRTLELTRGPVPFGMPALLGVFSSNSVNHSQKFSSVFKSTARNFSRSCSNYDKATASISSQQADDVFKSQDEENPKPVANTGGQDEVELQSQPFEESQQPQHEENPIHSDGEAERRDGHLDSPHSQRAKSEALPPTQNPESSGKVNRQSSIIERLRKLSMTDISQYPDTNEEPLKNSQRQFDPRLLKMVNIKNKVKSGGGGYGQNDYNYNSYDRPNSYNRRGIYDGDDEEYDSPRQAQKYSSGGSSFRGNYQKQRQQGRMDHNDDYSDDEEDIDFDVSRKQRGGTDSVRLSEQAQIRRGGAITTSTRRPADVDDDDYEEIVRNRFANRRENSRATRSDYD